MQRLLSISLSWGAMFLFCEVSWDRAFYTFRRGRASPRLLWEWFDVTISTLVTPLAFWTSPGSHPGNSHSTVSKHVFLPSLPGGKAGSHLWFPLRCNSSPPPTLWGRVGKHRCCGSPLVRISPLTSAPCPRLTALGQFLISFLHPCNIFSWVFWVLLCSPAHPSFSWLQGDFSKMQLESCCFLI